MGQSTPQLQQTVTERVSFLSTLQRLACPQGMLAPLLRLVDHCGIHPEGKNIGLLTAQTILMQHEVHLLKMLPVNLIKKIQHAQGIVLLKDTIGHLCTCTYLKFLSLWGDVDSNSFAQVAFKIAAEEGATRPPVPSMAVLFVARVFAFVFLCRGHKLHCI